MRENDKMTNELSELLQAKHRLEEAEMRETDRKEPQNEPTDTSRRNIRASFS